jgi:hypothetical protein
MKYIVKDNYYFSSLIIQFAFEPQLPRLFIDFSFNFIDFRMKKFPSEKKCAFFSYLLEFFYPEI